ncbi:MAG: MoxR family ATPase [Clostridiaceae bacterium]|nr:MoxR family ATPase [Clostridiaceae bacterium]
MEEILVKKILDNVEKVIMGKQKEIMHLLKGIISGGHILIEDVPGVGKTMLVKAICKSLNLSYSRIQFTPDLLPSDITGVSIYNPENRKFEFNKGPVFSNIVLADEINRTSPKTQSALLEVMEEYQVSEGVNTYLLKKPFIVLATQNPVEYEGTFNLPEAQLDRFMMKIRIGYADKVTESEILQKYREIDPLSQIESVASESDIIMLQEKVKTIKASKAITDYIVNITDNTRNNKYISLGASTRGSLCLLRIAQASALVMGRDYVIPDDVKNNAVAVLSHRIKISSAGRASGLNSENIVGDIIERVDTPRAVQYGEF